MAFNRNKNKNKIKWDQIPYGFKAFNELILCKPNSKKYIGFNEK